MVNAVVIQFPTMTLAPAKLPNRVRALRKAQGLTLAQLAAQMNMSTGHIANIERGDRELTLPVMRRMAGLLHCTAADLLNPEDGGLLSDERRIVSTYREVPPSHRQTLAAVAEAQQEYRGQPVLDFDKAKRAS